MPSRSVVRTCVLTAAGVLAATVVAQQTHVVPFVLSSLAHDGLQKDGSYLLPTNQLLRPWGEQAVVPGRPVELAFDSAKNHLAVLNWKSVLLVDPVSGATQAEIKTNPTSYAGLAFRPGDRELWASETSRNGPDSLAVIPLSGTGTPGEVERVNLQEHPVPTGIAFQPDGERAFVALSRNNTLGVIVARTRLISRQIPVGIAPFGVVVSAKQGKIFVSNRGGRRPRLNESVAASSGTPVLTDPVTGSSTSGTVSVIDLQTLAVEREVSVGLAPSSMALSPDEAWLAVANGHSDTVSLINTKDYKQREIKIPDYPADTLGAQPIGVQFSPDGRTLYVACGGTNSIVAVSMNKGGHPEIAGAVPTGWFPSSLAVAGDGSLRVLNIKGLGNTASAKGNFNSRQYEGSLIRLPAPVPAQWSAGQREVATANRPVFNPQTRATNPQAWGVKHVFLIVKENRTYDQIFGDMPSGNGDPKLAVYGKQVTPNHHALAEKYVLLDNFYTGGAISFDGHQWLMQGFVSDYVERAFAASPRGYAWNMADALVVPPTGFFWQGGGTRKPVDLQIYGEFCVEAHYDPDTRTMIDMNEEELLTWRQYWDLYKADKWRDAVGSRSGVPALAKFVRSRYPADSTAITDQIRASAFLEDFAQAEKSGQLPQLTVMTLNQDHTNGTRPGSPSPRAMVADDDLALGRIVEGISKSRFWATSLIFVVEDDAQDGFDHVNGRRTVAMAIGPHVRRKSVVSDNYNHASMIRTIQEILGVPSRTRALQAARPMYGIFSPEPDTTPYAALPETIPLDEMNPPLKSLNGKRLWAAQQSARMNWKEIDDVPEKLLNQILWWEARGYDAPYPGH